jgi:hypothetical protein
MKITANDLPMGCQVYKNLLKIKQKHGGKLTYGKANSGYCLTLPNKVKTSEVESLTLS